MGEKCKDFEEEGEDLETAKENLELQKNIVKPDKYAWKMLWVVESCCILATKTRCE